jgi:hypothetical protein
VAGAVIVGLIILAWTLAALLGPSHPPSRRPAATASAAIDPLAATITDDLEWQHRLQRITVTAGEPCERVMSVFHQGMRAGENLEDGLGGLKS